jgi:hypothetical protein
MNIYHYCNFKNFNNILESRTVWLTPVETMNDREEVVHLYLRVWEQARNVLLNEYGSDDWARQILATVDHEVKVINIYTDKPYCSCFSDDGDLLQQWRLYADDGSGFSIGFNFSLLGISDDLPHPNSYLEKALGVGDIIYGFNEQLEILLTVIRDILSERTNTALDWLLIIKNLRCYSPVFKNHTFYTEQERRIIYYHNQGHDLSDSFISGPYDYRDSMQRFELNWYRSEIEHCIERVFIGPKNPVSVEETLLLLNHYGIKLSRDKVIKSISTYR